MKMKKQPFLKGAALLALARRKAGNLGIDTGGKKMVELVHTIQEREGHTPCFRKLAQCQHLACCWQASCGAVMKGEQG